MFVQLHEDGTYWRQIKPGRNFEFSDRCFQPPETLTPEEAELYRVFPLTRTERLTINTITHVLEEADPAPIEGVWTQKWATVALDSATVAANTAAYVARVQAEIVQATQDRLDAFARTRNYDGILSACTYATSTVPRFAAEGQYAVTARDQTWAALYNIMGDVEAGERPMPTDFGDVEADLPDLIWP